MKTRNEISRRRNMGTLTAQRVGLLIMIAFVLLLFGLLASAAFADTPDQAARWKAAKIDPRRSIELDKTVALYQRIAPRYQDIQAMRANGVPAPVVFCLHQRESSGSFSRHPHEGSPLTHRTLKVPKGRLPKPDPPYTFEQSAEDAYYVVDRLDRFNWKHSATALQAIEGFNGLGYQLYHPDVPSPYLWAATSLYSRGKYTDDGRWDKFAVDRQLGAAAILKRMQEKGTMIPF